MFHVVQTPTIKKIVYVYVYDVGTHVDLLGIGLRMVLNSYNIVGELEDTSIFSGFL